VHDMSSLTGTKARAYLSGSSSSTFFNSGYFGLVFISFVFGIILGGSGYFTSIAVLG